MKNNNFNQIFIGDKNLDSYILNSAKYYATKLVRNGFFDFYDLNDLEQEILALFYYRIKKYSHDETKSSIKHWVSIIMEGIYGNLVEKAIVHNKFFSKKSLNDYSEINKSNSNNESKEIIEFIEDDHSDTFESYC